MLILAFLGLSTMAFSLTIGYYTYQIDTFSGETSIVGTVIDSSGMPLEGVKVESDGIINNSDENGFWKLVGVKEGKINVDFYLPGYIKSRYNWIAYPMSWIKNETLNGSSNDLSDGEEIILYRETDWEDIDVIDDVCFDIHIWLNLSNVNALGNLSISNETGEWNGESISEGENTYRIKGGGAFSIRSFLVPGVIHGFNTVNDSLNLTDEIIKLIAAEGKVLPGEGKLTIGFGDDLNETEAVVISCYDINLGSYFNRTIPSDEIGNNLTLDLTAGSYNVSISGESFIDRGFSRIDINEGIYEYIEVNITKAQVNIFLEELSVRANYMVMVYYIVLSMFLLYGIYIAGKGTSWMGFVLLSFISFLSRGIPTIGPINFNIILATVLVMVAFIMRSDFLTRYRNKINAYDRNRAAKEGIGNENNK